MATGEEKQRNFAISQKLSILACSRPIQGIPRHSSLPISSFSDVFLVETILNENPALACYRPVRHLVFLLVFRAPELNTLAATRAFYVSIPIPAGKSEAKSTRTVRPQHLILSTLSDEIFIRFLSVCQIPLSTAQLVPRILECLPNETRERKVKFREINLGCWNICGNKFDRNEREQRLHSTNRYDALRYVSKYYTVTNGSAAFDNLQAPIQHITVYYI